jgi:hypothetical protein
VRKNQGQGSVSAEGWIDSFFSISTQSLASGRQSPRFALSFTFVRKTSKAFWTSLRKGKSTQFTELIILCSWGEAQFTENWSQSQLSEKSSKMMLRLLSFGKTRKIRLVTHL